MAEQPGGERIWRVLKRHVKQGPRQDPGKPDLGYLEALSQ